MCVCSCVWLCERENMCVSVFVSLLMRVVVCVSEREHGCFLCVGVRVWERQETLPQGRREQK